MSLGKNLYEMRKKFGLFQEIVAEKLNISRQTISKWETDETVPDIYQSKVLAKIYGVPIDKLVDYDSEMVQIEETIKNSDEEKDSKINWTKAWGKNILY